MLTPFATTAIEAFLQSRTDLLVSIGHMLWEFVRHYLILVPSLFLGWFCRWRKLNEPWARWDRLRLWIREAVPFLLVLAIFQYGETITAADLREQQVRRDRQVAADLHEQRIREDRQRISRDIDAATEHRAAIPPSDSATHLAVVGEEIAQISTRTFDLIQDSAPDLSIRTLTVFLKAGHGDVENLLQEGTPGMGRSVLAGPSLVGKTIETGQPRYCPDVNLRQEPECNPFHAPSQGVPLKFASLACYPLTLSTETFASVCIDSRSAHAFDGKIDKMWEDIEPQLASLRHALNDLRVLRASAKLK